MALRVHLAEPLSLLYVPGWVAGKLPKWANFQETAIMGLSFY